MLLNAEWKKMEEKMKMKMPRKRRIQAVHVSTCILVVVCCAGALSLFQGNPAHALPGFKKVSMHDSFA
jgi:hypothetical protein